MSEFSLKKDHISFYWRTLRFSDLGKNNLTLEQPGMLQNLAKTIVM